MKPIKILLVDDQKCIREKLKLLIEPEPNLKVVGTADNGVTAIEKVKSLQPEIIILDLDMPKMGGIEASKIIHRRFPKTKIIIFTSIGYEKRLSEIEFSTTTKLLLKGTSESEILQAIKEVKPAKTNQFYNFDFKQYYRLLILISPIFVIALLLTNIFLKGETSNRASANQNLDWNSSNTNTVIAPGTIVPKGEIIKLSVANAQDSRVNQIFVEEGDRVRKGQIIAILQGIERRKQDLVQAETNLNYQVAKLKQTIIGNDRDADLDIQEAEIDKALANLRQAQVTHDRNEILLAQGAVSQQVFDESKEAFDLAKANYEGEHKNLARLVNIKPIERKMGEIEVEAAKIAVAQRKADLEDTKVRVPVSGQILRINTRVGEQVNTEQGIVELGRTDKMYAIAEVYETDIGKVKIGQPATVSSEYGGFTGNLKGTVEQLGLKIGSKSIVNTLQDPTQDENSRIVEVKIRLNPDDSQKVANFTHMGVQVKIGE